MPLCHSLLTIHCCCCNLIQRALPCHHRTTAAHIVQSYTAHICRRSWGRSWLSSTFSHLLRLSSLRYFLLRSSLPFNLIVDYGCTLSLSSIGMHPAQELSLTNWLFPLLSTLMRSNNTFPIMLWPNLNFTNNSVWWVGSYGGVSECVGNSGEMRGWLVNMFRNSAEGKFSVVPWWWWWGNPINRVINTTLRTRLPNFKTVTKMCHLPSTLLHAFLSLSCRNVNTLIIWPKVSVQLYT